MNPRWGNWDTRCELMYHKSWRKLYQQLTIPLHCFSWVLQVEAVPSWIPRKGKSFHRNGSSLHYPHIHLYLQSQMVTCWPSQLVTGKARGRNEGLLFKCYSMAISDSDTLIAQKGLLLFVCFLFLFSSIGDVMDSDGAVM
jgi:hypothetical protein